ncbi:MAG: hypothetical protein HPY50_15500 [Firmicutes bacterium]|nr:hypothetical protein [Bacillota bacterium]
MSNKVIMWSMLILPWFTLLLMKREEVKRYMPVGLFAIVSSIVIVDIGATLNLWALRDNIFPFGKVFSYHLGGIPVVTMWLFKFTYGRFLRYVTVDVFYNLAFAFLMSPWLAARGIRENVEVTALGLFFIITVHGILLYIYQLWQENALIPAFKEYLSPKLRPAATKPFFKDRDKPD